MGLVVRESSLLGVNVFAIDVSRKKPGVSQGLRRMKTERDRRIVAYIEARGRKMLRAMTKVRVKMG